MNVVAPIKAEERVGNSMHTRLGNRYYPFDPRPGEVRIFDIAHHLANKCRYAGATTRMTTKGHITAYQRGPTPMTRDIFYSVAEHSVYVSHFVPKELALTALLHDASEAYNGDLIRPLKSSPEFAEPFRRVEELNEKAIAERYGLQFPFPPEIKIADDRVTRAELDQIVPNAQMNHLLPTSSFKAGPAPITIQMLPPYEARSWFLERFLELYDI